MKKLFKYIIPAAFFLILLFKPDSAYADEKEATIAKGVYIDTVDIGGMTVKEAQAALKKHIESLRGKSFAVLIGDATLVVTMEELDYKYEPNNYIEQAVKLGKAGNLIQRYKDNKDIEHGKKVYPLTYTYNEDKLMKILEKAAEKYKVKPKNATFTRKNSELFSQTMSLAAGWM